MPKSQRIATALPDGSRRSHYWTFKGSTTKADLVVSRDDMGDVGHISFHGAHRWHLSITGKGEFDLGVKPEITQGARHALSVVTAPSACTVVDPAPDRVAVVYLIDEHLMRCSSLDVFLLEPGITVESSGPAPSWTLPLGPDGGPLATVSRCAPAASVAGHQSGDGDAMAGPSRVVMWQRRRW
ncbi:MAG TPA: hypothetical protein VIQ02_13945 [Jiangellaceae bacterium]